MVRKGCGGVDCESCGVGETAASGGGEGAIEGWLLRELECGDAGVQWQGDSGGDGGRCGEGVRKAGLKVAGMVICNEMGSHNGKFPSRKKIKAAGWGYRVGVSSADLRASAKPQVVKW